METVQLGQQVRYWNGTHTKLAFVTATSDTITSQEQGGGLPPLGAGEVHLMAVGAQRGCYPRMNIALAAEPLEGERSWRPNTD